MKKLIIFSLMIVSALSVDAQRKRTRTATTQGNVVVRLGMGVNSTKWDPDGDAIYRGTSFHFGPSIGYMVVDNLELGGNLGVSYGQSEDVFSQNPTLNKTVQDRTDVNFGIYLQKYFPLNNWFAFYTYGNLGLSTGTENVDNVVGSITTRNKSLSGGRTGVGGAVNFGFSFTPYNAFAVYADLAGLSVATTKWDPDGTAPADPIVNTTDVGFNVIGNTNSNTNAMIRPLTFGCAWYFGRGLWKK
ncbi:MAG: outer membrane beta-barrel protein [Bacteroidetes bacterium]|nr:outer membrane beta-barrel protein [Bacteroidota bacterium]